MNQDRAAALLYFREHRQGILLVKAIKIDMEHMDLNFWACLYRLGLQRETVDQLNLIRSERNKFCHPDKPLPQIDLATFKTKDRASVDLYLKRRSHYFQSIVQCF